MSQGRPVAEAIRAISATPFTYYRWRRGFGRLKRWRDNAGKGQIDLCGPLDDDSSRHICSYQSSKSTIRCIEKSRRRLGGKTINRTSETTVIFNRPFVIDGFAQELPAGDYVVETEEELIEGLSFPAYRRVSTTLRVDRIPGRPGQKESWQIAPEALEAALLLYGADPRTSEPEFESKAMIGTLRPPVDGQSNQGPMFKTIAIFLRPFAVPDLSEVLPAGEYAVQVELQAPLGCPDPGRWKASVLVQLHPTPGSPGLTRTLTISLANLKHALAKDKLSGRPLADFVVEEMLADPMVRLFMESDGVTEEEVRRVYAKPQASSNGENR